MVKEREYMKKLLVILFAILLLTSCSGAKTVTKKDEAKAMAEEFYKDLLSSDPIEMTSYLNDQETTVFTKDGDKMYTKQIEAGYDYYLFMEDGKKYLISSDGTVFEDESMYDMSLETINTTLLMNVMGYFEVDNDSVTYKATNKNDKELEIVITAKQDNEEVHVTSIGKKNDDGNISEITSETKSGDQSYKLSYKFAYDKTVELPEYKMPVTYDNMPHVDSPYKTIGEIINNLDEDESLMYAFFDNQLVVVDSKDSRHYQFSATVDQELLDTYSGLDAMEDDYDDQVYSLLSEIEIEDCIDFTDAILSEDVLDSYNNKTIEALVNDGFEINGTSFNEDDYYLLAAKDLMDYKIEVIPTEGFDFEAEFEYTDFNEFTIKDIEFDSVEYAALPMK